MKIINYSHARTNLRKVLDEVEATNEVTVITSKNSNAYLLSKDMYELMQSKINKESK